MWCCDLQGKMGAKYNPGFQAKRKDNCVIVSVTLLGAVTTLGHTLFILPPTAWKNLSNGPL